MLRLFFARHMNTVAPRPCFQSSVEMQTSVSLPSSSSRSLSLYPPSFPLSQNAVAGNTLRVFNFKPLSLSSQQNDTSPSPALPPSVNHQTRLNGLYFMRGKAELAQHMFEKIPKRDVSMCGAIIAGLASNGMPWEALKFVRLMVEEGVKPNLVVMMEILYVIGEVCDLRMGREAHGFVMKMTLYSEQFSIQSALVDMYSKCGDVDSGSRVLYSLMRRNDGGWTSLMSGQRLELEMRSLIRYKRFQPGITTVASLLPKCAQLRALKQGKEIHAYALRHWFLPHVSIVSSLMVLYSKCGVIEYSTRLFDGMEQRNVILWTAMIDSYLENGHLDEALGIMRSMQLTEHRPDTVTVSRMLHVCGKLRLVKFGKEVHGQVLRRDFASTHYVAAELINMYGACRAVDKAKLVFDAVPVKGSMTWGALIRAYGYKEWYKDAIDLFDRMIASGCSPNHFTFEVVLSICDKAGFVDDCLRIFTLMPRYKIEAFREHCTILIRLLTRYGKLDEAQRFVEISDSLSQRTRENSILSFE